MSARPSRLMDEGEQGLHTASTISAESRASADMMDSQNSHSTMSHKTAPDFEAIHKAYSRAIRRGRHPNSFPRESEMWYHYKNSLERVKKVSKGRSLGQVIEEEVVGKDGSHSSRGVSLDMLEGSGVFSEESNSFMGFNSDGDASASVSGRSTANDGVSTVDGEGRSSAGSKSGQKRMKLSASLRTIHGVQFDIKNSSPVHYGMVFLIMTTNDEILCLDETNNYRCKKIDKIGTKDRFCFRVFHLGDPSNPGVINYGQPVWMQVLDTQEDKSLNTGIVLAAKPFEATPMQSMQPNLVSGMKNLSDHNQVAKKDQPNGTNGGTNGSNGDGSPLKVDVGGNGTAASNGANGKEKDKGKGNDGKNMKQEGTKTAEIIGEVMNVKVVERKDMADMLNAAARNHTKQSWYLGQWLPRSAIRGKMKNNTLMTQAPIYLEQDLYCLAHSEGTGFRPWPKKAEEHARKSSMEDSFGLSVSRELLTRSFKLPKLLHVTSDEIRASTNENMHRMMGLVEKSSKYDKFVAARDGANSTFSSGGPEDGFYGCLRKILLRGPPYKHLVDRRCIWKLCAVDQQAETTGSVKDAMTQELMKRAIKELRRSEADRKGTIAYRGMDHDGKPLTRGEGFPSTLRSIILQKSLEMESNDMVLRRQKEKYLEEYFQLMAEQCSVSRATTVGGSNSRAGSAFTVSSTQSSKPGTGRNSASSRDSSSKRSRKRDPKKFGNLHLRAKELRSETGKSHPSKNGLGKGVNASISEISFEASDGDEGIEASESVEDTQGSKVSTLKGKSAIKSEKMESSSSLFGNVKEIQDDNSKNVSFMDQPSLKRRSNNGPASIASMASTGVSSGGSGKSFEKVLLYTQAKAQARSVIDGRVSLSSSRKSTAHSGGLSASTLSAISNTHSSSYVELPPLGLLISECETKNRTRTSSKAKANKIITSVEPIPLDADLKASETEEDIASQSKLTKAREKRPAVLKDVLDNQNNSDAGTSQRSVEFDEASSTFRPDSKSGDDVVDEWKTKPVPLGHFNHWATPGERVAAIHDAMHLINLKAQEAAHTKEQFHLTNATVKGASDANVEIDKMNPTLMHGGANVDTSIAADMTASATPLTNTDSGNKDTFMSSDADSGEPNAPKLGFKNAERAAMAAHQMAMQMLANQINGKVTRLKGEDEYIGQVLHHRERLNQYNKISKLFQDINNNSGGNVLR